MVSEEEEKKRAKSEKGSKQIFFDPLSPGGQEKVSQISRLVNTTTKIKVNF